MRLALFLAILAIAPVHAAETARGHIMEYECGAISPSETGFTCHFDAGQMRIQWHERVDEMPPAKSKRAKYEFSKIAVRYFELGGRRFDVTFDDWDDGRTKTCYRGKGRPFYDFTCPVYGPN